MMRVQGLMGGAVLVASLGLAANTANAAPVVTVRGQVGSASASGPASPRLFATSYTALQDNRVVIVIGARATSAPTISEVRLMASGTPDDPNDVIMTTADAGPATSTNAHTWVYSGVVNAATTSIANIRVTFSGTVNRMTVLATEYNGLARTVASVDTSGSGSGSGNASPINTTYASGGITTTRANTVLLGATAVTTSGTTIVSGLTTSNATNSQAIQALVLGSHWSESTTAGAVDPTLTFTFTGTALRTYASLLVAYNALPDRLDVVTNPSPLASGTCSTFTFRTRSAQVAGEAPPFASTNITVTSSSASAQVRIGSCPSGGETNSDSFALASTASSFNVGVVDVAGTGLTLTASRTTGGEALLDAVANYDVLAGALYSYCIVLPGQTFVEGQCSPSGYCYLDDPPSQQTAGVPFSADFYALDGSCFTVQPSPSSVSLTWYGFSQGGDGSDPTLPNPLNFDANGYASGSITAVAAETIQPYFEDASALLGVTIDQFENFWNLDVVMPANTTTIALSNPNALTPVPRGYSARANGEVEMRIVNGTGGAISTVTITDPDGAGTSWSWVAASSTVYDSTGTTNVTSPNWTVSLSGSSVLFTAASASSFPAGSTLRFRARNTGAAYPNLSSKQTYAVSASYTGFQSGSASFAATEGVGFTVSPPLPQVGLPAVARSQSFAPPRFTWTNVDSTPASRAGVLIVRGVDAVSDTRSYSVGEAIGTSRVVCKVSGATQTCDDSPGGGNDLPDGSTANYRIYQYDSNNGYSAGTALSVAARPSVGFFYRHNGTGLGDGTAPNSNEAAGGAAPGATPSYAVFTSNSNSGMYFVENTGAEHRRAVATTDPVARRVSIVRLNDNSYMGFAADTTGRRYRIDPNGTSGAQVDSSSTVAALMGPGSVTLNQFGSLNSAFNGDGVFFATNAGSGNRVRAVRRNLTTLVWDFSLTGTEAVGGDVYVHVNAGVGTLFVPVAFGASNGIYGVDLSAASPSAPSGWSGQRILSGQQFRTQCRKAIGSTEVFCGDTAGTVYAINASTGAVINSFSTGTQSLMRVAPTSTTQGLVYVTRQGGGDAQIGRLTWDGASFTSVWATTVSGATVLSAPLIINAANVVFVTADVSGTGSLVRLLLDDAMPATAPGTPAITTLDGNDVSDPVFDVATQQVLVQTDNGTIWGFAPSLP